MHLHLHEDGKQTRTLSLHQARMHSQHSRSDRYSQVSRILNTKYAFNILILTKWNPVIRLLLMECHQCNWTFSQRNKSCFAALLWVPLLLTFGAGEFLKFQLKKFLPHSCINNTQKRDLIRLYVQSNQDLGRVDILLMCSAHTHMQEELETVANCLYIIFWQNS